MERITKRIGEKYACYAICEKECPDGIYADNAACMCTASKMAMKRLLEYEDTGLTPEQIVEQTNAGWIPVEERLPIPNKEVWVTVKRNGKVFTSTDGMTEKGHFWNYEKENILAWKEKDIIPEPYRPEVTKP